MPGWDPSAPTLVSELAVPLSAADLWLRHNQRSPLVLPGTAALAPSPLPQRVTGAQSPPQPALGPSAAHAAPRTTQAVLAPFARH